MQYTKSERTVWRDTKTAPMSDNQQITSNLLHNHLKTTLRIQPTNILAICILHQIREAAHKHQFAAENHLSAKRSHLSRKEKRFWILI